VTADEFQAWAEEHGWRVTAATPAVITAVHTRHANTTRTWVKQEGGRWKLVAKTGRRVMPGAETTEVD
jgi:hypothetical protein